MPAHLQIVQLCADVINHRRDASGISIKQNGENKESDNRADNIMKAPREEITTEFD